MNAEFILTTIHFAAASAVFILLVRMILKGKRTMQAIFFTFSVGSFLLGDAYSIVHFILFPWGYMPFSANEICTWASYLMLGATLSCFSKKRVEAKWETLFAGIFIAASTVLWISRSGEWVRNLMAGAAFGYFFCRLIYSAKQSDSMNSLEWFATSATGILVLIGHLIHFFANDSAKIGLEVLGVILLIICILYYVTRAVFSLYGRDSSEECFVLSAFSFAVSTVAVYMSTGIYYYVALGLTTLMLPLMFFAIRKEVQHDLH